MPVNSITISERVWRVTVTEPAHTVESTQIVVPEKVTEVEAVLPQKVNVVVVRLLPAAEKPQKPGDSAQSGGSGFSNLEPVFNETPAGAIDGANATFTALFEFYPGTVQVFVNGVLQQPVKDFSTTGTQIIEMRDSPDAGEDVTINYLKAGMLI